MPRYAPENIHEVGQMLPSGAYVGTFEEFDDSETTSTGKYQILANLRVEDPIEFRGTLHRERWVIGSDQDKGALDPQTWEMRDGKQNIAAQLFCDGLKKAGVTPSGDTEQDFSYAKGQKVGFLVTQSAQAAVDRDGQPNQYAGRLQSQITRFFRIGEREAKVFETNAPRPPAPGPQAAPPAAPAPRAATPVAPRPPSAPVAPAAPRPPQAAPQMVQAPLPPSAPAPPAAPMQAPTPAAVPAQPRVPRAPRVPKSEVTKCQICSNLVPHSDVQVQTWDQANPWMYEQRDDNTVWQLGIARHVEVCATRNVPEE